MTDRAATAENRELPGISGNGPDRIRTCDLRFRRPTLYPAELRARGGACPWTGNCRAGYDRRVAEDAGAYTDLIHRFYGAFARRDAVTMAACYAPAARFSDPVFQDLRGDEVPAMWRMLCERGTDLELSHLAVSAECHRGAAHREADYTCSGTGRRVHNEIDASSASKAG